MSYIRPKETMRGSIVLQALPAMMCFIAASEIYLQNLGSAAKNTTRRHLAASVPAIYTFLLLLIWVLPIQIFLIHTLDSKTWFPIVALTLLGVVLGSCLPRSYFKLRSVEVDGKIYTALGVRRFRKIVAYGGPMVGLMRRIDRESYDRLKRSTLTNSERGTRRREKIHWALLLGTIPTAVWAVLQRELWFAVYLLAANIPMNIYPILLQRYTRARLEGIKGRAGGREESV
jgi:hypothetical protein